MNTERAARRLAELTQVWPDTAYTGVDAWELCDLLASERACSAVAVESEGTALVRPYVRERS